jgi:hypothetical protein
LTLSISFYDNIIYHRDDFIKRDKDFFGNGLVNLTDFPITYNSNMTVSLGAGTAWVDGFRIANDSSPITPLNVQTADTTNPRIDIVQIGHDDLNQTYSLQVKKGVAASSPIEPGADPGYIKLYAINVAANATSITSSNVTDRRSLVPLNVSATQISFGGAPSTSAANTFTQPQTAPQWISNATTGTAPLAVSSSTKVAGLNSEYVNGYDHDQSVKSTSSPTFVGMTLTGIITRIKNLLTAGNFGVLACLANTTEQLLNTTSPVDILTFTPTVNGNYETKLYIRCANANTMVTAVVTWYDASGNQRTDTLTSNQLLNVDGYSAPSAFFNAITSGPIKITVTAGTAGNIYCSASILGV